MMNPSSPVSPATHAFFFNGNSESYSAVPLALADWFENWQADEGGCMQRLARMPMATMGVFEGTPEDWHWATLAWNPCTTPAASCQRRSA